MKSFGSKLRVSFTLASLVVLMAVSLVAYVANAEEHVDPRTSGVEEFEGSLNDLPPSEPPEGPVQERVVEQLQDNGTGTQAIGERANNVATRTEAVREQVEERRAALTERTQERVRNLAANMSNKMDAAAYRFGEIIKRLRSRMVKLESADVNTRAASQQLTVAENALQSAMDELSGIDAAVERVVASETPREAWQSTKSIYRSIMEDLRATRAALRESVAALKAAVSEAEFGDGVSEAVRNNANATETATTTNTEL